MKGRCRLCKALALSSCRVPTKYVGYGWHIVRGGGGWLHTHLAATLVFRAMASKLGARVPQVRLRGGGARFKCTGPLPRSHQTFRPVITVKLMGIMLRNRCWSTNFHTITVGDVNGWC